MKFILMIFLDNDHKWRREGLEEGDRCNTEYSVWWEITTKLSMSMTMQLRDARYGIWLFNNTVCNPKPEQVSMFPNNPILGGGGAATPPGTNNTIVEFILLWFLHWGIRWSFNSTRTATVWFLLSSTCPSPTLRGDGLRSVSCRFNYLLLGLPTVPKRQNFSINSRYLTSFFRTVKSPIYCVIEKS